MITHGFVVNKDYDDCNREIEQLKKTLNVISPIRNPNLFTCVIFQDNLGEYGVFLYPTFHTSAIRHNNSVLQSFGIAYTMIFNVLGFPSTHVPLGLNKRGLPIGIQVSYGRYQVLSSKSKECMNMYKDIMKVPVDFERHFSTSHIL